MWMLQKGARDTHKSCADIRMVLMQAGIQVDTFLRIRYNR